MALLICLMTGISGCEFPGDVTENVPVAVEGEASPSVKGLKVIMLNVGQGDAILILTGEETVLVDGGADGQMLQTLMTSVFLWQGLADPDPESEDEHGLLRVIVTKKRA